MTLSVKAVILRMHSTLKHTFSCTAMVDPCKNAEVQAGNIRSCKFGQEFHSRSQRVPQTVLHIFSIYCGDGPQLLSYLVLLSWKSFDLLLVHATLHDLLPRLGRERKLVQKIASGCVMACTAAWYCQLHYTCIFKWQFWAALHAITQPEAIHKPESNESEQSMKCSLWLESYA